MSDAVIALVTAMMTTIGLAMVNKLMSRPSEHWKQASEMRGELRADLDRSHDDLERAHTDLDRERERNEHRDREFIDLKEQLIEFNIKMRTVSAELRHCLESHKRVDGELDRLKLDIKTCIRTEGPA